ncbi:DNA-processing protein DprA [Pectinatus frisingensis]|uniref:DNA-processing protein DprA n=1 Tax=Pectinatus frisingensis TaxID=865 RepID=UPI0018C6D15B|nr:DNA-processing protein DprA [Pectinatus frisingensis]
MEKYYLAALQMVSGMGITNIRRLLACFSCAKNIWDASEDEITASKCLSEKLSRRLFRHRQQFDVDTAASDWDKRGIRLISILEDDYPKLLTNIYNPPAVLFCRGNSITDKCLAVVGARKFSVYGKSIAYTIAADLAKQGYAVVSGAAHGIDTFAHCGALTKGQTIAVLGCGVDMVYPRENKRLLDEIAEKGTIISEYAPKTQPLAAFFPARNRIISGLSIGTVVIEAAERSGSLITAEMALSEGRDVFAVPGSIYSEQSRGCNHLIQQGAKLITCAQDIYEEYDAVRNVAVSKEQTPSMTDGEAKIYNLLSYDQAISIDEIIYKLRANVTNISFVLLQMKLKKIIDEASPGMYVRSAKGRI